MSAHELTCIKCGKRYSGDDIVYICERCGGLLDVKYDYSAVNTDSIERVLREESAHHSGVWKFSELLPFGAGVQVVSVGEGNTPLYHCDRLGSLLGVRELYVKHEGLNPTGSFKDRGMTVGVTKAVELGVRGVACASTGNTSASLSVFAARASLPCYVLLPKGKVALGKLAQAIMHGAMVFSIRGNFDDALYVVRELCERANIYLLNSVNPYRLEGQKTIAFEIAEQLTKGNIVKSHHTPRTNKHACEIEIPDRVVIPVGNAGNISAIYKGFWELKKLGFTEHIPKMTGIQAEGASPIVDAFKKGEENITPVEHPETIATAIRIGNPVNAQKALHAIRESGGVAETVSDDEITDAQKALAGLEGIGVEPASASSIAGLRRLIEDGVVDSDERVVCIATGNLLKDPEHVVRICKKPLEVDASVDALLHIIRHQTAQLKPNLSSSV
ncbi:threonine synthase [Methanosarcinales archaeon]|nr:MAG: threonine synthase [Methanosarcinales archaeon]